MARQNRWCDVTVQRSVENNVLISCTRNPVSSRARRSNRGWEHRSDGRDVGPWSKMLVLSHGQATRVLTNTTSGVVCTIADP
jgi:hypothetical protein